MDRRTFIEKSSTGLLTFCLMSSFPLGAAFARSRRRRRTPVIVIDPGHGGIDPGAIGHGRLEEKHVVLDIAKHCASDLAVFTGASVHLTRTSDIFLTLEKRVAIARALRADFFMSIHADSAPSPEARGLSVYTLSEHASDRFSAALAKHENAVDSVYGVKLQKFDHAVTSILFDMARRETLNISRAMQDRLIHDLKSKVRLLENPARHANFAVLRSPVIPGALIESGFLSNRHDEAKLRSHTYRRHLATKLARSFTDAFSDILTT